MLKRELAPLDAKVWEEIDNRAVQVLKSYLSARKVIKVNGPKGWDYTSISDGRLNEINVNENNISYGTYSIKPLVESRIEFSLNRWELDNFLRGAKDIDLKPLEEAVKAIAIFEENAIYNGLEKADIKGLTEEASVVIPFGNTESEILDNLSEGVLRLNKRFVQGPFTLIVGEEAYKLINSKTSGYPLVKRIENITGKNIVLSHALKGALLLPFDHDDLEFTIGNDFSIGYQLSDNKEVRFFVTESFAFRILDNDIIVKYNL